MVSPLVPVARMPAPIVGMVQRPAVGNGGAGEYVLFKQDGTPIKNPAGFIAGIQQRGYKEPIYGATGNEIRDPVKWLESYEKRKAENGGVSPFSKPAPTSVPRAAPVAPVAPVAPAPIGGKPKGIFQADG